MQSKKQLVGYVAYWCRPCKEARKKVEDFLQERSDVTVYWIDIEKERNLVKEAQIFALPTMYITSGEKETRLSGVPTRRQLEVLLGKCVEE